jgi:hypothetical protein
VVEVATEVVVEVATEVVVEVATEVVVEVATEVAVEVAKVPVYRAGYTLHLPEPHMGRFKKALAHMGWDADTVTQPTQSHNKISTGLLQPLITKVGKIH